MQLGMIGLGRMGSNMVRRLPAVAEVWRHAPAPVLSAALYARFNSRGDANFADKVLGAMRYQFGGHEEKKVGQALSPANPTSK